MRKSFYKKPKYFSRRLLDKEYIKWRTKVYRRDNYKCQWPGCKHRGKKHAHHIWCWANYPTLRYELSNGITLCYAHHKQVTGQEEIYAPLFITIIGQKHV